MKINFKLAVDYDKGDSMIVNDHLLKEHLLLRKNLVFSLKGKCLEDIQENVWKIYKEK